mmetsp:Transcript_51222/g.143225  ORF Transcript_51222/g.143225 Transcript_51222/m.143225 type:complete len:207 (+) Transcript_51222:228-848(+)
MASISCPASNSYRCCIAKFFPMATDSMKPMRLADSAVADTVRHEAALDRKASRLGGKSPPSMVPTRLTWYLSCKAGQSIMSTVPAQQPISGLRGPNHRSESLLRCASFLQPNRKATQTQPRRSGAGFASGTLATIAQRVTCKCCDLGMSTPRKYFTWLSPMMMAEPLVKPLMTGCPRKHTRKLRRRTLPSTMTTPTSAEVRKARLQ